MSTSFWFENMTVLYNIFLFCTVLTGACFEYTRGVQTRVNTMNQDTNTEHKNGKAGRIIAVVVAVLVIAALIVGTAKHKKNVAQAPAMTDDGCKPGYLFSEVTGKPCPATTEPLSVEGEKATTEASGYEAAVAQYAGKLVVVDAS